MPFLPRPAALVLALLPHATAAGQRTAKPTVAVMYFNNSSLVSHDEYEPLRAGVADILITELQSNSGITVVERDALRRIVDEQGLIKERRIDPATAIRVGRIVGAQHMIFGGFIIDRNNRLRLDARAVNVQTSIIEHVETIAGSADSVLELIGLLAQELNAGMKLPVTRSPARDGQPSAAPSNAARSNVSAFQAVATYSRAMAEEDAQNKPAAITLYRKFLDMTPPSMATVLRERAERRLKLLGGGG